MARGNEAKDNLINQFIKAAGDNYLGTYDKKYYFLANEGGEKIQVAVTLTCPKTAIEFAVVAEPDGDWDFTDDAPKTASTLITNAPPAEITETEIANIAEMMKKLGL